jgi:hypothetical protein
MILARFFAGMGIIICYLCYVASVFSHDILWALYNLVVIGINILVLIKTKEKKQ